MPKSSKKRKDKAADFTKAKLKLGKGKKAPSNVIDTSYKARSIALPQQSILTQKDDSIPTTKRRLSLNDLIIHLKHYSAATRKEALTGFRELLEAHPELIATSLTDIIGACVRVIADEDAGVRRGVHSFMAWLLPQVPMENVLPHASLLVLFTTSAQTHIFPEIRIDAVKFLGLLLEYVPSAVTSGWYEGDNGHGSRILEGYLGLLSAGTKFGDAEGPAKATSTASVVLTPASKLVVLQSLSSFLGLALSAHGKAPETSPEVTTPSWFFSASFATPEAFDAFDRLLRPTLTLTRRWQDDAGPQGDGDEPPHLYPSLSPRVDSLGSLSDLLMPSEFSETPEGTNSKEFVFLVNLARSLHGTLVATYLDCAPTVFIPSRNPNETELQLVLAIGKIAQHMYSNLLRSTSSAPESTLNELSTLLGYMSPHFPFTAHGGRDIKIEQAYQELNLIYCELSSLLTLQASRSSSSIPSRRKAGKQRAAPLSNDAERVCNYVIQLLLGEAAANSGSNTMGRPLAPIEYTALLPTIWSLLSSESTEKSALLKALLDHATRAGSKSVIKRLTIEFIGHLILAGLDLSTYLQLQSVHQYRGTFRIERSDLPPVVGWLEDLPKTLWEVGAANALATEAILRLLLRMCQWRSSLMASKTLATIATRLVPFFHINHPQKGALPGPWIKLAPSLRRLAMEAVAMLLMSKPAPALANAVDLASSTVSLLAEERVYWACIRLTFEK